MSDPLLEAMRLEGWDSEEQHRDAYRRDPQDPAVETLHERKVKAEVRRLDIQNAISMRRLFSRRLAVAMMESIGQEIKTSFIDLPRRVSGNMANMAKNPGIEKEFENFLAGYIQTGILNVKIKIKTMCENGFFENVLEEF